jgi:hypothetical protein
MIKLYASIILFLFTVQAAVPLTLFEQRIPYSTNDTHLTIWNGSEYVPFFVKGMNLGIAIPGTFPGELEASRKQYGNWFKEIKDAGFNSIRLYTLHYPHFYAVLDSFNVANPHNPLLFFQGVWLNEEMPGYEGDLYMMTDTFKIEIEENIDCVHGNKVIPQRYGKAFGTYTYDVSKWCLGYIIGREVYPEEIITTNSNHVEDTQFIGNHLSITNGSPSEVWFTEKLNHVIEYEQQHYTTQRPVSVSSWPTLDPIIHPEEQNQDEDKVSVDLSKITLINAPAGLFISYHAYPYYPDFVSQQSSYLPYKDNYGNNSYIGYLTELKSHYPNFPLIIAEYGVPSSWGIAHYATSSMNHGGFDEKGQGDTNIRLLQSIQTTNCGGGIQFAWIDEWFKRTWVTDPIDYINDSRVLWHNITAAEQNYGLKKYEREPSLELLQSFDEIAKVSSLKADGNYTFFEMEIGLKKALNNPDEMWIALDTYSDEWGESILPNGVTSPIRAEYVLHITNHSANLYVTQAYDIYGKWHKIASPEQQYKSITSDGKPWYVVRWKNNNGDSDVQYIGSLQVNYGFQNLSSKDGVVLYDDKINIRIPWSLLNVVAPDKRIVLHDDKNTPDPEDIITDGFHIGIYYQSQWHTTTQRYAWKTWNAIDKLTLKEVNKTAYWVMQERLPEFNTPAFAVKDTYVFDMGVFPILIDANNGILKNDFDIDGNFFIPLITEYPQHGDIILNNDGSFSYQANIGYIGYDSFTYCIFDGYSLSTPNTVELTITKNNTQGGFTSINLMDYIVLYPTPTSDILQIETQILFDEYLLFNTNGTLIQSITPTMLNSSIDVSYLSHGIHMLVAKYNDKYVTIKFIKE